MSSYRPIVSNAAEEGGLVNKRVKFKALKFAGNRGFAFKSKQQQSLVLISYKILLSSY